MIRAAVLGGIVGFALGVFITVLALATLSIIAFTQSTRLEIPGVFAVWADSSTGSPGLAFEPNFVGVALMIAAITLGGVALGVYARSHKAAR